MNKIKVFQLLNRYSNDKILARLFQKYPDQKNGKKGYLKVLEKLRSLEPKENDNLVKCEKFGCHMIKPGDRSTWAFGPTPWEEVLGSYVAYANIDFICNLLWELTFYGFTEKENKVFFDEVFEVAEDVKSGKEKTVKFEDFIKEIK